MLEISTPDNTQIPALRQLWKEAFGDSDAFLDTFYTTAFCKDRCLCVSSHTDVVAALYWFDCSFADKPVAYIYAVATAKACQKQGLCHKLLKNTHQHLKSLGYTGALLVPGDRDLFHLYEGMGYQTACYMRQFSCTASTSHPDTSQFLRRIEKAEYATLRRRFLPVNGVIQESENLDFLEKQMDFYAGEDFLLTACIENNALYGTELLGNTDIAPQILQALGCQKGTFRTPGKDTPFAMYYTFDKTNPIAPAYFGLAFD